MAAAAAARQPPRSPRRRRDRSGPRGRRGAPTRGHCTTRRPIGRVMRRQDRCKRGTAPTASLLHGRPAGQAPRTRHCGPPSSTTRRQPARHQPERRGRYGPRPRRGRSPPRGQPAARQLLLEVTHDLSGAPGAPSGALPGRHDRSGSPRPGSSRSPPRRHRRRGGAVPGRHLDARGAAARTAPSCLAWRTDDGPTSGRSCCTRCRSSRIGSP